MFHFHRWVYKHKYFRICEKCGEMQEVDFGVAGDLPWRIVPTLKEFNDKLARRIADDEEGEKRYQARLKEQEKAKSSLNNNCVYLNWWC